MHGGLWWSGCLIPDFGSTPRGFCDCLKLYFGVKPLIAQLVKNPLALQETPI